MNRPLLALLLLPVVACTPNDAEVTGDWFVWLAANSSATVAKGDLDSLQDQATVFECRRGWNPQEKDFGENYIGPREESDYTDPRYIGGDCPRDDNGDVEAWCEPFVEEMDAECARYSEGLDFQEWARADGYYSLHSKIEPWRTEVVLNQEGSLELHVHQELGNNKDFRWSFSIRSDFTPITCGADENGNPVASYVDDANWVDQWSADEDGYKIYYLNAGAYQLPDDANVSDGPYYYLPWDWQAGFGYAKWADDIMTTIPTAYGREETQGTDTYFRGFTGVDVADRAAPDMVEYENRAYAVREQVDLWEDEMVNVLGAYVGSAGSVPDWRFRYKVEDNIWRPIDTEEVGLDGWMEMHGSWVRIKDSSKIEEGAQVEGDFQLFFGGSDSNSHLVVRGEFNIPELKVDRWAYEQLEETKRAEEGGQPFCGGAAMP